MLLVGVLLVGAAGCTPAPTQAPRATGPVDLPAPTSSLAPTAAAACARLLAALPGEIDPGVERRPVDGPRAAWGDPAVVLECGVPPGDPADPPATINGLEWTVRDTGAGFLWSTLRLGVNVSVAIPGAYDNGAELVNPLAAPVLSTLPVARPTAPGS